MVASDIDIKTKQDIIQEGIPDDFVEEWEFFVE